MSSKHVVDSVYDATRAFDKKQKSKCISRRSKPTVLDCSKS